MTNAKSGEGFGQRRTRHWLQRGIKWRRSLSNGLRMETPGQVRRGDFPVQWKFSGGEPLPKTGDGLENGLANLWSRKIIAKSPRLVEGWKPRAEIPFYTATNANRLQTAVAAFSQREIPDYEVRNKSLFFL